MFGIGYTNDYIITFYLHTWQNGLSLEPFLQLTMEQAAYLALMKISYSKLAHAEML